MAVAFDAKQVAQVHTSGATSLDATNLTVGSGSNRVLLVYLAFATTTTLPTAVTVTWDNGGTNQAATLIVTADSAVGVGGASERLQLYGLVNPIAGNKTLHVAWTNSVELFLESASFTGADQTGGATTFAHNNSASGTGTSASVTITSATGNIATAVFATADTFSSLNNTTLYTDNAAGSFISAGANYAAGAASVALSGVVGTSNTWGVVGCEIVAAAANPFSQSNWPIPRGRSDPTLSYTRSIQQQLIGQDKLPFRQTAWPIPKGPTQNPALWPYFQPMQQQLLTGQDRFFGLAGHPNFNWPVPRGAQQPTLSWVLSTPITLAPVVTQNPFVPVAWPVPRGAQRPTPSWVLSASIALTAPAVTANPFIPVVWPAPLGPPRGPPTYVRPTQIQLIGQDQFFGLAGNPNFNWPVPRGPQQNPALWPYVRSAQIQLIGQDALPFRQSFWPAPGAPQRAVQTWVNQFNIQLKVTATKPRVTYSWPNPIRRPVQPQPATRGLPTFRIIPITPAFALKNEVGRTVELDNSSDRVVELKNEVGLLK